MLVTLSISSKSMLVTMSFQCMFRMATLMMMLDETQMAMIDPGLSTTQDSGQHNSFIDTDFLFLLYVCIVCIYWMVFLLWRTSVFLLTYACLLTGSIGHRPRYATVFCPWPSSPFLTCCIPPPLFLISCLFHGLPLRLFPGGFHVMA